MSEIYEMNNVEVKVSTPKAILVVTPLNTEGIWIPKSLIQPGSEVINKGDQGKLIIPWWIAEKQGLIEGVGSEEEY